MWPRYIFFSIGGPFVNPQTLSILASVSAVLYWIAYAPEFNNRFANNLFGSAWVGSLAMIWIAWRLFASAVGEFPLHSLAEYFRDLIYLSSFLLIGCALACYESGTRWLLRTVVLSGMMVAMVGVVEAVGQRNHFVQFAAGGDAAADALRTIILDKIRGGSYRAQSVFDHPIVFAQFIAAMIPLAVYCVFYERGLFWRTTGLLAVAVGGVAIVKTGSRAGVVSLAVAISFFAGVVWTRSMVSKGFGKAFAFAALPLLALGLVVAYLVVEELLIGRTQVEISSTSVRLKMVADGIAALSQSPVWGFGHGTAISKAGVMSPATGTATIDSMLLSIALDSGYVGLTLFIAFIVVFAVKGVTAAVRLSGEEGIRVGLIVASVMALVATFTTLSITNNMTLLWLLVSMGLPSIGKAIEPMRKTA